MFDKPRILSLSSTRLINSIKHEHSCKFLYFSLADGTTTIYFATSSSDTPAQGMYEEGISIKGIPDSFQPLSLGKETIVLLKTLLDIQV